MHGITGIINPNMMKNISLLILTALYLSFLSSCGTKTNKTEEEAIAPRATVSITTLKKGQIEERIKLNARTVFLIKNEVVTPISGYITAVDVRYGQNVEPGQVLFEIQTRENRALQESGKENQNSSFGKVKVKATTSGVINQPLVLGKGAYVTEGETLCIIADNKNLLVVTGDC